MKTLKRADAKLRDLALALPETTEDFPWGHRAVKVKGKAFTFMTLEKKGPFTISVKLPRSAGKALLLPFVEPTHYGMGKHGWVTATFAEGDDVPVDLLHAWLRESFVAIAPKKIGERVSGAAPAAKKAAPKRKPAPKATAKKS